MEGKAYEKSQTIIAIIIRKALGIFFIYLIYLPLSDKA